MGIPMTATERNLYRAFLRLFYADITAKERQRIITQLDTRAYYTLVEKARLNADLYEEDFRYAHDKNLAAMHTTPPLYQRLLSRLRQLLRGKPAILALPAAAYLSMDNYLHHYPFKKKDSAAHLGGVPPERL